MTINTQAVSMECSYTQYKKDLLPHFSNLGLQITESNSKDGVQRYIYLKTLPKQNKYYFSSIKGEDNCVFIETYNPELFLALAAMTEGESPIVGEWMYRRGELYKVEEVDSKGWWWSSMQKDSHMSNGKKNFINFSYGTSTRKATKEEIMTHLSNYMNPIARFKEGDTVTILRRPRSWSSRAGGSSGLRVVDYPYTFKVRKAICFRSDDYQTLFDGEFGWSYDKYEENNFILESIEPKKSIMKDNWYIVINKDNRDLVREWWIEQGFPERLFNLGAYYGISNGRCYCHTNVPPTSCNGITKEEFKQLILNKNKQYVNDKIKNTEGESCKVSRPLPRITRGKTPRGTSIRGRASSASIKSRPLEYRARVIKC